MPKSSNIILASKMPDIAFSYLYRDEGNYKQYNNIIFSNPDNLSLENIENQINAFLIDGVYFYHFHFNIPPIFFPGYDKSIDVSWHEFESVCITIESINTDISISQFLSAICNK